MTPQDATYAFDNTRSVQRERLSALEELLDAGTFAHLSACEPQPGWRCLEVGAGGGSIANWLAARVGREGRVLATDLDPTVLREQADPAVEVVAHDITSDPLPEAAFDLIHARLLLAWLPDPQAALARLVAALAPGGWLVCEEMDFGSIAADPRMDADDHLRFDRVIGAHNAVLATGHSFDHTYGRRLSGDLADAGLADVQAAGRAAMWTGGAAGGRVWRLTLVQLRDQLIASSLTDASDVDHVIGLCDSPRLRFLSQVTVAATGRRQ